jgi:hypothetical protein
VTSDDCSYPVRASRCTGECEFASVTDPSVLGVLLRVRPGLGKGYGWVEFGACGAGWQVPYYTESVG